MRVHLLMLCCLTLAFLSAPALAGDKKSAKVYEGYIVKLPDSTIVFEVPQDGKPAQRRILYVNDDTTINIDGKPATWADLTVGMAIRITPKNTKIAKSVEALTPKKKN